MFEFFFYGANTWLYNDRGLWRGLLIALISHTQDLNKWRDKTRSWQTVWYFIDCITDKVENVIQESAGLLANFPELVDLPA